MPEQDVLELVLRLRDEMGAQLDELGKRTADLEGKQKKQKSATDEAADATRRLATDASRAGAAAARYASSLGVVHPALGLVVGGAAEAQAAVAGLNVSMGVLAPVAAAVMAGALAWKYFAEQAKEAEAAAAKAAKTAQTAAELSRTLDVSRIQAGLAEGSITQEEANRRLASIAAADAFEGLRTQLQAERAALRDELGEARAKAAAPASTTPGGGVLGFSPGELTRQQGSDDVARLTAELEAKDQVLSNLAKAEEAHAARLARIADNNDRGAKAAGSNADATGALGLTFEAAAKQLAAWETASATPEQQVELRLQAQLETLRQIAELYPELTERAKAQATAAAAAADAERERLKEEEQRLLASKFERRAGADKAAERALADAAAAQAAAADATTADTVGTLLGLAGGNVGGLMAALGPVGVVAQGLGAVGAAGGAQGVREGLEGQVENILTGIRDLPEIVGEVLPDVAMSLARELPRALLEAAPDLVRASLEGQWEIAKFIITELPGVFYDAVLDALKAFWDELKGLVQGDDEKTFWQKTGNTAIDVTRVLAALASFGTSEAALWGAKKAGWELPRFDRGSEWVAETGLALEHRGEEIVPEGGRSRRVPAFGGGGVTVNISGVVTPDVLVQLDQLLRGYAGYGLEALGA